jgi:hypothetical protein
MKSVAIHQKNDWYLVNLPGYSDIPRKQIKVDVSLAHDEIVENDYKSLRGAMIMERYLEKEARSIVQEEGAEFLTAFDELFGTRDIHTPDDLLDCI